MHWRGVEHADMTEDQLYCRGPVPAWAEGVVISHREKAAPSRQEQRDKKLVHAREMLKRAETRLLRAETLVKRWRRRAGAAERAIERGAEPKMLVPAAMAADRERS